MSKQLILVVGVGRSGTSLFAGIMGKLGFHIPQPEVQADDTNPKGFGEPKWVVDFHTRIMRRKRVTVFDARPKAWELTAAASAEPEVQTELRAWLKGEVDQASDVVVVKDPRVGWFLPLWTQAAANVGVSTSFVTMLRHPAQILTSAKKSYGTWQTDASRAAAWINVMLESERATRGERRAFIPYGELLTDWAGQLRAAGERLDVAPLASLDAAAHPDVDEFVDPSLFRNRTGWEGLDVPQRVIDLAEEVWAALQDADGHREALDGFRDRYDALYGEAEAISHSSVIAVRPRKKPAGGQAAPSLGARVLRKLKG
ncbi:MAG: sulfotransferase family protein [Solirubrobacteraceae bacterium]